MTVKLEVPQIDKELLSKKETMISDLELEKAKLEAKIQEISSQYNLVLSNADELKEKVEIFQTRCVDLEQKMKNREDEAQDLIR